MFKVIYSKIVFLVLLNSSSFVQSTPVFSNFPSLKVSVKVLEMILQRSCRKRLHLVHLLTKCGFTPSIVLQDNVATAAIGFYSSKMAKGGYLRSLNNYNFVLIRTIVFTEYQSGCRSFGRSQM